MGNHKKINLIEDALDTIEEIKQHIKEIEIVKKNPSGFDCTIYVMQKIK